MHNYSISISTVPVLLGTKCKLKQGKYGPPRCRSARIPILNQQVYTLIYTTPYSPTSFASWHTPHGDNSHPASYNANLEILKTSKPMKLFWSYHKSPFPFGCIVRTPWPGILQSSSANTIIRVSGWFTPVLGDIFYPFTPFLGQTKP